MGTLDARVLEALPTAVLVVGAEGTVRYVNDRGAEILGRSGAQLVGLSITEILGSALPTDQEVGRTQNVLTLPGPSPRTIGYTVSPLNGTGDTVLVFQDISRFIRLREERDKLMSLAAIGEALPSLLHELKNPLAAITTAVEVLLEDVAEGDVQQQLHAILSELRRMALGFEGIGAVHGDLRSRRSAAIDYACREACRVLENRAKNAGVYFRYAIRDMPLLPLDPSVVRALVFNFVTNGIHACERGDTVRLEASLDHRRDEFRMSVVDNGSGMTPDVLESATKLFFTTKASGSGIGLALCRRVVEDARGELVLRSVPGFGTQVQVCVPIGSAKQPGA